MKSVNQSLSDEEEEAEAKEEEEDEEDEAAIRNKEQTTETAAADNLHWCVESTESTKQYINVRVSNRIQSSIYMGV